MQVIDKEMDHKSAVNSQVAATWQMMNKKIINSKMSDIQQGARSAPWKKRAKIEFKTADSNNMTDRKKGDSENSS